MAGFSNDTVFGDALDVGVFPNTTSSDNSNEFNRSGSDVTSIINNTSDTASSGASHICRVEGSNGGDPFYKCVVGTSDSFAMGMDTSVSPSVLKCTYRNDQNASPSNFTNTPWQVEGINTITGASRLLVKSALTVSSDTTGTAAMSIDSDSEAGVDATLEFIQKNGTDDARIIYSMLANNYAMGVDASDSDSFFLTQDSASEWPPTAANTIMKSTVDREVTFPGTPAFLATHTVAQNNVTGNGTEVVVNFTTTVFDQNSDYDGTNNFTAPVTGRYYFCTALKLSSVGTGCDTIRILLRTSNRDYNSNLSAGRDEFTLDGGQNLLRNGSTFADMDAGDIAELRVTGDGLSGNTQDIPGSGTETYFSGFLQC